MSIQHVTGKAYAVRREGTRVLYVCHRSRHEEWFDFRMVKNLRNLKEPRRTDCAEQAAAFAMGWHSEAKGGAYVECKKCRQAGA